MPYDSPETSSSSSYQLIFDNALAAYKKKTGKDLKSDPLLTRFQSCNTPDAVLELLRGQIPEFGQSGSSSNGLTNRLNPTVNIISTFSATVGDALSLVNLSKVIHICTNLAF